MDRKGALIVVLVAFLVLNVSWTAAVDQRSNRLADRLERVENDQELVAAFVGAKDSVHGGYSAEVGLYAYSRAGGEAVAVPTSVTAVPADGLYLDVGEVAHTATLQQSLKIAWQVANASAHPPARRGGVVGLSAPAEWDRVGGGSAALAMGLAFAATDPCVGLNESVAVTGGLADDGTVVQVEHVREKAVAARERNVSMFVVPTGQGVSVSGIRVVEVSEFSTAAAYALEDGESCGSGAQRRILAQ